MRILRIFYDWPGKWDGLAPAGYEITKEQLNQGHKVTLMCGYWRTTPPEKLPNLNIISIFREPFTGLIFLTSSVVLFFKYFSWRNKYKVDVIHSHGHFAIWVYLYRKLVKKLPYLGNFEFEPVFVTQFHNTFQGRWESLKKEGKIITFISEKLFYPLGVMSDKWAIEVSNACLFVSQNLLDEAIKYYNADPAKCFVIENGVNTELFKRVSELERSKTRADLGFDTFDKVVINYGKMVPRKNITNIIKAIKLLPVNYRLILIGDGPKNYNTEITNLIGDLGLSRRVKIYGYSTYNQVVVPLQAADVFVLPSFSEGIARAALEALHLGVPCVLRDVDGNRELIRPRHNGALFTRNEDLPDAVRAAAAIAVTPNGRSRESLLPDAFRQKSAVDKYLHLVESR
jgi:glycosyltransferase involved in cell wall biosynthesis